MICRQCGAVVAGDPEHCPTCGALLAQTGALTKATTGALVSAFFRGFALGIAIDFALIVLGMVLAGVARGFANQCTGPTIAFAIGVAVAVAIPALAIVRSYKKPAKDGLFWAGFVLTTFVPFMPCSLALVHATIKC